jgi:hypothetical protein
MKIIINNGKKHSGTYDLNLLYNENNIFVMDNHLAASWCWLQKIDIYKEYNLFHIDRHYDLLHSQLDWWIESLNNQNINLQNVTIHEVLSLRYSHVDMPTNDSFQIFRWDNYITIFNRLFPNVIEHNTFATHKDGDIIDEMNITEIEPWDLQDNLSFYINSNNKNKWIVNLDIDYFFTNYDGAKYIQLFSDEFIVKIAKEIKKSINNIAILTIALSPEMCGGWNKSQRILKLISDELELKYIL